MTDSSAVDIEIPTPLQDALKSLKPILRRAMDLSSHDVSAVIVEPILASLGWDVRDPRQARRPDEAATLKLLSSGKAAMTVRATSSLSAVPDSISGAGTDGGEWIVVTNGTDWNIFNHRHLSQPFRTLSLKDAAAQKDASRILAMLARAAFQKDGLTEAWMSEAVDRDIERILARHLDGSAALVEAIKAGLTDAGVTISDSEIRAALSRIDIAIGDGSVTRTGKAEVASVPAPASAEARPAAKAKPRATKAASAAPKAKAKPGRKPKEAPKVETPVAEAAAPAAQVSEATPTEAPKAPKRGPRAKQAASTTKTTPAAEAAPVTEASMPEAATAAVEITTEAVASEAKAPVGRASKRTNAKAAAKPASGRGRGPKSAQAKLNANVALPQSPEELGWPDEATHAMHRKKNIVFMTYDAATEKSTILPGSLIVASTGKALNPTMVETRENAIKAGDVEPYGAGMYQVKKAIEFHSPRAAASFAAATLVKDLSAWKTKDGTTLAGSEAAEAAAPAKSGRKPQVQAEEAATA